MMVTAATDADKQEKRHEEDVGQSLQVQQGCKPERESGGDHDDNDGKQISEQANPPETANASRAAWRRSSVQTMRR